MDFLGIGPLELLFIIVLALIVLGPRDLAQTARSLGRILNRLYRSETWRMLTEASHTLRGLPNRLAREARLEELDATRGELQETDREMRREVEQAEHDLSAWTPQAPSTETDNGEPEAPEPSTEDPA